MAYQNLYVPQLRSPASLTAESSWKSRPATTGQLGRSQSLSQGGSASLGWSGNWQTSSDVVENTQHPDWTTIEFSKTSLHGSMKRRERAKAMVLARDEAMGREKQWAARLSERRRVAEQGRCESQCQAIKANAPAHTLQAKTALLLKFLKERELVEGRRKKAGLPIGAYCGGGGGGGDSGSSGGGGGGSGGSRSKGRSEHRTLAQRIADRSRAGRLGPAPHLSSGYQPALSANQLPQSGSANQNQALIITGK